MQWSGTIKKGTAALLLFFSLTGASLFAGGSSESSTSAERADRIVVLVEDWRKDLFVLAAERYSENHPGIEVKVISAKYNELKDRLAVMIAAGDPPDIIASFLSADDISRFKSYFDEKLYKFGEQEIKDAVRPDIVRRYLKENPYSLPLGIGFIGMVYNRNYFDEFGFSTPERMSWDELIYAFQEMKKAGGLPVAADRGVAWMVFRMLYASECASGDPDYLKKWVDRRVSFFSPLTLQMAGKISILQSCFPENFGGKGWGTAYKEYFEEKKYAVLFTGFHSYNSRGLNDPDFEITLFPSGDNKDKAAYTYASESVSVLQRSPERTKTALEFIKMLTSEEVMPGAPGELYIGSLWSEGNSAAAEKFFEVLDSADHLAVDYLNPFGSTQSYELLSTMSNDSGEWILSGYDPLKFLGLMEKQAEKIIGPLKAGAVRYDEAALASAWSQMKAAAAAGTMPAGKTASASSSPPQTPAKQQPSDSAASRPSSAAAVSATSQTEKVRQTDRTGPRITILYPETASRGVAVEPQTKELRIIGKVSDASGIYEVTVNGYEASVGADGTFQADVRLAYGENRFSVVAEDVHANRTVENFSINRATEQPGYQIPAAASGGETGGDYHALLIGVERYADRNISQLQYPVDDASELGRLLSRNYTFSEDKVTYLRNPTRQQILKEFESLRASLGRDDNLLIYYAGHGYWDEQMRQGFWLPVDARRDDRTNWLSNSTVTDYLRAINTKHILLISDACFSGSIFQTRSAFTEADVSIRKMWETPSRRAITSGNLATVPDESVFSRYLRKRLSANTETYLYSQKLYVDFKDAVTNNSPNSQAPQYGVIQQTGDEGGDFIFVRRR